MNIHHTFCWSKKEKKANPTFVLFVQQLNTIEYHPSKIDRFLTVKPHHAFSFLSMSTFLSLFSACSYPFSDNDYAWAQDSIDDSFGCIFFLTEKLAHESATLWSVSLLVIGSERSEGTRKTREAEREKEGENVFFAGDIEAEETLYSFRKIFSRLMT